MTLRELLLHRKLGWLAVIGPLWALASIWISISLSPWFAWRNNAVSDLGVHAVAPLFNSSLVICGIMCAVFSAGMAMRPKRALERLGMAILLLASISLVGIGLFNEHWSPHHMVFSVAFFVLLLVASLILTPYFMLRRATLPLAVGGLATMLLVVFDWAAYAAGALGPGVAVPEAMTFVPGAVWITMMGHRSLGRPQPAKV